MKISRIVAISLVCVPGLLQAQQSTTRNKPDTTVKPLTQLPSAIIPISEMDQRKIFRWDNGQSATPSGRQAGDPKAIFARVIGDSAIVVQDWTERLKSSGIPSAKH